MILHIKLEQSGTMWWTGRQIKPIRVQYIIICGWTPDTELITSAINSQQYIHHGTSVWLGLGGNRSTAKGRSRSSEEVLDYCVDMPARALEHVIMSLLFRNPNRSKITTRFGRILFLNGLKTCFVRSCEECLWWGGFPPLLTPCLPLQKKREGEKQGCGTKSFSSNIAAWINFAWLYTSLLKKKANH